MNYSILIPPPIIVSACKTFKHVKGKTSRIIPIPQGKFCEIGQKTLTVCYIDNETN